MKEMPEIKEVLDKIHLPEIVKVTQRFTHSALPDVGGVLWAKLASKGIDIRPGQRIAITCGSRGIDQYSTLVKTTVDFVRSLGGIPILIPAMGSHGGGTAEGQAAVLYHYGITEEAMGAQILSSMEVVQIGVSDRGLPVLVDKNANECDGIILLNRVKCHTAFRGAVESGLTKMTAIGLAKQQGADMTHVLGFDNMAQNIISVGKVALSTLKIVCGIASIEDSFGEVSDVEVLYREEILEREPELLREANAMMPRFYLDKADALIIYEQGKDYSGSGFDSNIIGRYNTPTHLGGPRFTSMGVLDLSEESEGNANGMGAADFATRRFYEKIDFEKAYMNGITSTAIYSNSMPMILATDKMVVQAAVKFSGKPNRDLVSLVIAHDTKHIDEIYMSRAALEAVPEDFSGNIEVNGPFTPIPFDEEGNLTLFN